MGTNTTYGILGTSDVPREVIVASLTDSGKGRYVIPWYGTKKISPALEYVYDWLLDNEMEYVVIEATDGRPLPNAIKKSAASVEQTDEVDMEIMSLLEATKDSAALIMWDESNPQRSLFLASTALGMGIKSLELTNGLVPIIVEDSDLIIPASNNQSGVMQLTTKSNTDAHIDNLLNLDTSSFDRETLEVMPAVSVKRMAANAGFNVKTKEEAINALTGTPIEEQIASLDVGTVLLMFNDGTELGFSMNKDLLKKIMDVVLDHQANL